MQNQDFWQTPHYFQDLPCLENTEVWELLSHYKGQKKRNYSVPPCAALCWNRHRAPWSSTKARDHLLTLLPSHLSNSKCFISWHRARLKITWALALDWRAPGQKSGFRDSSQGEGRGWDASSCTLCSREGSQAWKKEVAESFIWTSCSSKMCWTLIFPSQILNPPSDFTHTKNLFRQMRLFKYSGISICSYVEHRTAWMGKGKNY